MTDKAEAALKKLTSISQTLNEASDQLSKRIAEIESALNEYKLGITAWVNLKRELEWHKADDGRLSELTLVEQLGYWKHKGKWGLFVSSSYDEFDDPGSVEVSFLRDAPRETRLAAVDKLPELLKAIAEKAARVTEEATKKAAQAKEISAALRKKLG